MRTLKLLFPTKTENTIKTMLTKHQADAALNKNVHHRRVAREHFETNSDDAMKKLSVKDRVPTLAYNRETGSFVPYVPRPYPVTPKATPSTSVLSSLRQKVTPSTSADEGIDFLGARGHAKQCTIDALEARVMELESENATLRELPQWRGAKKKGDHVNNEPSMRWERLRTSHDSRIRMLTGFPSAAAFEAFHDWFDSAGQLSEMLLHHASGFRAALHKQGATTMADITAGVAPAATSTTPTTTTSAAPLGTPQSDPLVPVCGRCSLCCVSFHSSRPNRFVLVLSVLFHHARCSDTRTGTWWICYAFTMFTLHAGCFCTGLRWRHERCTKFTPRRSDGK
jgi:hypothetical protein